MLPIAGVPRTPAEEIARAITVVDGLQGHRIESLSLGQLGLRYARFLAQKVSTLSPLIASRDMEKWSKKRSPNSVSGLL